MGNVDCRIDGGIATVTFTNPPLGFLTSAMVIQLAAIMTSLEDDDAVRVIVFTGGLPDVFIRHFSVEEIIDMAGALRARRAKGLPDPHSLPDHPAGPLSSRRLGPCSSGSPLGSWPSISFPADG